MNNRLISKKNLHRVLISRSTWRPELNSWLKERIGTENYRYCKPDNAYEHLSYGFKNKEDALLFSLTFPVI